MSSFSCSTEFRQSTTCSKTGTDHASQHILLFPYSSYSSTLFSTPNSFPLPSLAPTRVNYKAGNFRVFNPNSLVFLQSCVAWGSRFQTFYVKLASLFFFPKEFSFSSGFKLGEREKEERIKRRERAYLFLSHSSSYHPENVLEPADCMSLGFDHSLCLRSESPSSCGYICLGFPFLGYEGSR